MGAVTTTVDAYFKMLNETDPERRSRLIEQVWAPDARWIDPPLAVEGHAAIDTKAAGAHDQFPGHRFRRTSGIDCHHDQLRFAWELAAPDGTPAVAGIDVGELAPDGRILSLTGFFGDLPDEAAA
jgi:SnoaL-like domain